MSNGPAEGQDHIARERATREHHHEGRSSEELLDKEVILKELKVLPGQTILDAGCGNGYMSKAFSAALNNTGMVYALDPDESAIAALQKETDGSNIHALTGDITGTTPFADDSVDLVYLATVIHGFPPGQIENLRSEVVRILKPRGRLAIVEIDKRNTPFGPPMDIRFSPEELQQQIALPPTALVRVGEYFYMQVFENRS